MVAVMCQLAVFVYRCGHPAEWDMSHVHIAIGSQLLLQSDPSVISFQSSKGRVFRSER